MSLDDFWHEPLSRFGVVLEQGRGALPFALVHGEPLVACAAWALGEAGIVPADASVPWSGLRTAGATIVLHDSLCPLTPPGFLARCARVAERTGQVVVGVRPVTDTVKAVGAGGVLGETLPREELWSLASPIVLPVEVARELRDLPLAGTPTELLAVLPGPVRWEEAPAAARRVTDAEDLRVLEALTAP